MQKFLRTGFLFPLLSVLLFSALACKTNKERQEEVADDNVLKSYINEPKDKAMAVRKSIEDRQETLDIDNYEGEETNGE